MDLRLLMLTSLTQLIGPPKEVLPQLRIKDSAVHAGLSQALAHLKVLNTSKMVSFGHSLNNSSLIARIPTETMAVEEV